MNGLHDLGLPLPVVVALKQAGICYIEDLLLCSAADLQRNVPNIGPARAQLIERSLARLGARLAAESAPSVWSYGRFKRPVATTDKPSVVAG